jgi:predicted DNA-binding WGR domain protein
MQKLVKIIPKTNQYRFYAVQMTKGLFGNWAVCREWGRIGKHGGTVKKDWYDTEEEANKATEKILKTKMKRGYQEDTA